MDNQGVIDWAQVVAPLAGAWIEIEMSEGVTCIQVRSLHSRERGLKSTGAQLLPFEVGVAPLAGAWIEMIESASSLIRLSVAPLAGAWIEIAGIS